MVSNKCGLCQVCQARVLPSDEVLFSSGTGSREKLYARVCQYVEGTTRYHAYCLNKLTRYSKKFKETDYYCDLGIKEPSQECLERVNKNY